MASCGAPEGVSRRHDEGNTNSSMAAVNAGNTVQNSELEPLESHTMTGANKIHMTAAGNRAGQEKGGPQEHQMG